MDAAETWFEPHRGVGEVRGTGVAALALVLFSLACGPSGATPASGGPTADKQPLNFLSGGAWGQGEEPKRGGIAVVAHREDPSSGWATLVGGTINLAGRNYVKGLHIPTRNRAKNLDMATVWIDK